ncbi:MAG: glutamine-hydrolyzing GMP synthase [Candidatus Diapherotrites archaeon]
MDNERILVLDFGSQYTHLLARRVRQLGVYSEILPPTASKEELGNCCGIILSGGPASVYAENAPSFNPEIFNLGKPILGLCYGLQIIAKEMGGEVQRGKVREYGTAKIEIKGKNDLFRGTKNNSIAWMSHGDKVEKIPPEFDKLASTEDCEFAAITNPEKKIFALQFHPEVTHTEGGMKILGNFLDICGCKKEWGMKNYLEEKIREIKEEVGEKKVFLLVSGGVDSSVVLSLLHRALGGERIYAMHVDNGFMRKDESRTVKGELDKLGMKELHVFDAGEEFLDAVKGVSDPEDKRKIIGALFVEIADRQITELGLNPDEWILGQGTIYPDTIETGGTKNADLIKTHHNRVKAIQELIEKGKLIEPLKLLYKDEVRELGQELGLPLNLVNRHPFPGPGLAIRALCSDGKEGNLEELGEKANELISSWNFDFNAVPLPVKAVGVQGDERSYRNVLALEGKMNCKELEECSTKLTNSMSEINRVVFALAPEKIESVKLLEGYLSKERLDLLREADAISMEELGAAGLDDEIWQFPTVLVPVEVNGQGESIVLRPVHSREAMTARFAVLPREVIAKMVERITSLEGIGAVFYDVTHKPPATIEWE